MWSGHPPYTRYCLGVNNPYAQCGRDTTNPYGLAPLFGVNAAAAVRGLTTLLGRLIGLSVVDGAFTNHVGCSVDVVSEFTSV